DQRSDKTGTYIAGLRFEVPGDGCVYPSGHNNTYFNLRRKFCLDGDKLKEIAQPFHYVGLKSKTTRALVFYSDLTMKRAVGTIEANDFVEVLIATTDDNGQRFLVRDKRGLTGWLDSASSNEDPDTPEIEGLFMAGD